MDSIPLLCLPYAGGSAQVYKKWSRQLDPSIQLIPIELAGRGSRMSEPLYEDIHEAVKDILHLIRDYAQNQYALFGHSMGCLIAYELIHSIHAAGLKLPSVVFMSGYGVPHSSHVNRELYQLPDKAFIEEVLSLGGTSAELFEHKELRDVFMPILRADFKLVGTYKPEVKPPLPLNLIVMNGSEDSSLYGTSEDWQSQTTETCKIVNFKGGHFFIHEREQQVVSLLNDTLLRTWAGKEIIHS